MNNKRLLLVFMTIVVSGALHAKQVPLIEGRYLVQAPENICLLADQAAKKVGFDKDYEVAVPTKVGIQFNPWNKFIYGGSINPQTQLPYIMVNPEWFLSLPQPQQTFWLVRCFVTAQQGFLPVSVKVIPYVYGIVSWIIIFLLCWALGKRALNGRPRWMRFIIALAIVLAFNLTVGVRLVTALTKYAASRHDGMIVKKTIAITHDEDVAVQAFQDIDSAINTDLQNGEVFWAPHKDLFKDLIKFFKK